MVERISQLADPIGAIIGFALTIMVLSYIIGDNILFRLAISIFIAFSKFVFCFKILICYIPN